MNNTAILKRLYQDYTRSFVNKIILSILFSLVVAVATSAIAWLLDPAIKKIFIEKDEKLILIIPILIICSFAAKGISLYLAKVIMIGVAEDVRKNVQSDMLKSLINADSSIIDDKHTGKFISNLTYDTGLITNLVSTAILNLFKDSLTLIGLMAVMFYQNWKLSIIAIVMIPLASFAARTLGKRIGKVSTEAQIKSGELSTYLVELFKNHKLIKIFQNEKFEVSRSNNFIETLKEKQKKIAIIFNRASPIMETLTGFMIALLIFYSGKLIINDELDINNFFSFLAAMMLAYQPVKSLAIVNVTLGQGISAGKRILPIIDQGNKISINENGSLLKIKDATIKFEKINFSYKTNINNIVLNDININIIGKKMTALVGHSGSGKSTLLNLIPRLYDADSGKILIDNQEINQLNLKSLREKISIVDQNTTLFDDTIFNNIKYAKPSASDDEVFNAAKISMCAEFINKLENKFETIIGENGVRLSGGEKQRLSIARALLKDSEIILLDEATSSLDSETEEKIQIAIEQLTKNKTTVVIAHRLSTILNSENIYVIHKGSVEASGKHNELMKNSTLYKNFYEKQIKNN